MNEKLKKFLKNDFAIGFLSLLIPVLVLMAFIIVILILDKQDPERVWHQYCIEDGDCKEGEELIIGGKHTVITKEYCLENHYKWNEEYKYCRLSKD